MTLTAIDPTGQGSSMHIELPEGYPSDAARAEMVRRWNAHPGMERMGFRLDLSVPGAVRLEVDPIQIYHRGGLGTAAVNGAVISGAFDITTGLVGYLHSLCKQVGVVQLSIQFLRPVRGDRFHVVGRPSRAGHHLVFTAAELIDGEDAVCARCDGMVAVTGDTADLTQIPAF